MSLFSQYHTESDGSDITDRRDRQAHDGGATYSISL
jgi:hypothetical protein